MPTDNVHLLPRCPWRPPDWRWQVVCQLTSDAAETNLHIDAWIEHALTVVTNRRRHRTHRCSKASAAKRRHEIKAALEVKQRSGRSITELKARILANEPRKNLAHRMQVATGTIAAFEKLFFDVRPKLHHVGWIEEVVLGQHRRADHSLADIEGLWLATAYYLGSHELDQLIDCLPPETRKHATLADYFDERHQIPAATRMYVAAKSCSLSEFDSPRRLELLMKREARLRQLERSTQPVAMQDADTGGHYHAVLERVIELVAARRPLEKRANAVRNTAVNTSVESKRKRAKHSAA